MAQTPPPTVHVQTAQPSHTSRMGRVITIVLYSSCNIYAPARGRAA